MKKSTALFILLLFAFATLGHAHAGEVHTYMGTVTMLHADGSFMMKTTAGKTITVQTAKSTVWLHADGSATTSSDLETGARVVVKISKDGKTALSVKMAAG